MKTILALSLALALPACAEPYTVVLPWPPDVPTCDPVVNDLPDPSCETCSTVAIDYQISTVCGLATPPHFEFNSSRVDSTAKRALRALAACLSDGPLRTETIKLVGRADPRGDVQYNFALGYQRAYSVMEALHGFGASLGCMTPTSAGEDGATGDDEDSWADDRRVDILLDD